MAGEADQLAGQYQHAVQHLALWVEAGFAQALGIRDAIAPATAATGQGVDLVGRQAQGLGHIANRPGAMVGADHRGQRCSLSAITAEHVLDDFLAAVVLEIHVDIRRLVALLG